MSTEQSLRSARVDLVRGVILEVVDGLRTDDALEDFAAAAPELLGSGHVCWELVFGAIGKSGTRSPTRELMLLSRHQVRVARRSTGDPSAALLSVAPRDRHVAVVVSQQRDRLARLDATARGTGE